MVVTLWRVVSNWHRLTYLSPPSFCVSLQATPTFNPTSSPSVSPSKAPTSSPSDEVSVYLLCWIYHVHLIRVLIFTLHLSLCSSYLKPTQSPSTSPSKAPSLSNSTLFSLDLASFSKRYLRYLTTLIKLKMTFICCLLQSI